MAEQAPIPLNRALRAAETSSLAQGDGLQALCVKAADGSAEGIQQLADWAKQAEAETLGLRRRLRKQEHDFSTLFEIVGQTSARSLDLLSMQTYLLRTVSGHFTSPKLLIVRRHKAEDQVLSCAALQGLRDAKISIPSDSAFCAEAMNRRYCLFLSELPEKIQALPEVMALRALGLQLAVPLIQEVEATDAVLEGFLLLGPRLANRVYGGVDLEFLNTLGKMLAICLRNEALYRRSIIDDLTGVASRGHFDARLAQEINRIQIYGHRSLGLVMLDIDKFKTFNDRYGHQTGDRVLQEMSRVLVTQVRNVDLVARYGGEEFAIILLEIEHERVLDVAQRLRRAVEALRVSSIDGTPLQITVSIGAAVYPDDAKGKMELIQCADQALYDSKDCGGNRVVMAPSGKGRLAGPDPDETHPIHTDSGRLIERRRPSDRQTASAPE